MSCSASALQTVVAPEDQQASDVGAAKVHSRHQALQSSSMLLKFYTQAVSKQGAVGHLP